MLKKALSLNMLLLLNSTAQAIENLPNDIFALCLIPFFYAYEQPLVKWSEISKNYTQKECYKNGPKYLNTYIKAIDDLSCHSWFLNYLSKDLVSLSLTSKKLYVKIYNAYKETIEQYRKSQICLCLEELMVPSRQHGIVQPAFGRFFEYLADKKSCKKNCQLLVNDIGIEYYLNYQCDQKNSNIRMLLAFTFGHTKCQKNEFFIDAVEKGYTFSCKKFGNFLHTIADNSLENDYMTKIILSLAFYIEQQSNVLLQFATYRNRDHRIKLFNYAKYHSIGHNDENRAIIGRHFKFTGQRFIILPFNVSLENKNVLRFIQLLPMYYDWDMADNEIHRISKVFPEPYPNILKHYRHKNNLVKLSILIMSHTEEMNLCQKTIELNNKQVKLNTQIKELKIKITGLRKKIIISITLLILLSSALLFSFLK